MSTVEVSSPTRGWIGAPGDTARQFVISPKGMLPVEHPVWILRQEPKRLEDICDCPLSANVLVIAEQSVAECERLFGVGPFHRGDRVCVCRCMGRFIE